MPDGHKLDGRSKNESRVEHPIPVTGWIEPGGGLTHEDHSKGTLPPEPLSRG